MTVGSDKKSGLMCGLLHKKMRSYEHLTHEDGSGKVNGPPTPHLPLAVALSGRAAALCPTRDVALPASSWHLLIGLPLLLRLLVLLPSLLRSPQSLCTLLALLDTASASEGCPPHETVLLLGSCPRRLMT